MSTMNTQTENTVFVIDDDPGIRDALQWLFESVHVPVKTYATATSFFSGYCSSLRGCLILDVRMPGMSGLELLEQLKLRKNHLPIIVITGHGDIPMAVRAMKAGATDFISKPFNDQYLLDQIQKAFNQRQSHADTLSNEKIAACFESLTSRERDIIALIAEGKLNKQIAQELNIALSTVEIHRSRVMQKMQAKTLAQLIKNYVLLESASV